MKSRFCLSAFCLLAHTVLTTLSNAQPESSMVTEVGHWDSRAMNVSVGTDFLCVGGSQSSWFVDISDPSNLSTIGWVDYPSVLMRGQFLFLLINQLNIFDVSIPDQPQRVEAAFYRATEGVMALQGDLVYIGLHSDGGGLNIVHAENPDSTYEISYLQTTSVVAQQIVVSDDLVILASESGFWRGSAGGLSIIDASDLDQPVEVYFDTTWTQVFGAVEHLVFVGDGTGLGILDVSDPATPVQEAYINDPDNGLAGFTDAAAMDGFAYVAAGTNGLRILDITDPESPQPTGYFVPEDTVHALALHGEDVYVAAGRAGMYIVQNDLVVTGSESEGPAGVTLGFELSPNYPNPFSVSTTITFTITQAEDVELTVIDLLGRPLGTPEERELPAGRHTFTFDASGLPAGVYFYRLNAGPSVATRRMVVLR